jgi:hypothetical protein
MYEKPVATIHITGVVDSSLSVVFGRMKRICHRILQVVLYSLIMFSILQPQKNQISGV